MAIKFDECRKGDRVEFIELPPHECRHHTGVIENKLGDGVIANADGKLWQVFKEQIIFIY